MLRIRRHQRLFTIMYNVLSIGELVFFIVGLSIVDWQVGVSQRPMDTDSSTPPLQAQVTACGHANNHC